MAGTEVAPAPSPPATTQPVAARRRARLLHGLSSPAARGGAVWVVVPLAIALGAWQLVALEPQPGLDQSWHAALHMAVHVGVGFGNHLVFTYGPLGFLDANELWYGDTGVLAFLYLSLVRLTLAWGLFAAARRSYGVVAAFFIALVVASIDAQAPETVVVLLLAMWAMDRVAAERRAIWVTLLMGALAGAQLLIKESVGIELSVLALVVALFLGGSRRRHVAAAGIALLATFLIGWTATGQSWADLVGFARNAERIVSGYAAAMSLEEASLGWQFAAGWVAFAVGLVGAWHTGATGTSRRRWGSVALWTAFAFFSYKEGFVRHDFGHGSLFFDAMLGGFVALRWRPGTRFAGLALTAALTVFALAAAQRSFSDVFDPFGNAGHAFDQVRQVASSSQRAKTTAAGRLAIRAAYPIDPETLSLLRGHTVHVAPYDTSVAWAYGLRWRPLPVFQSYSAYTTGLDQVDADALTSASAPERILQDSVPEIDGRYLPFDEGLTTRTIACRYRELRTTGAWAVLGLGPNRCAAPVALGVVHADWGQRVAVPGPPNDHTFVFVRVDGVGVGGLERLRALLYKPHLRFIRLDQAQFRLVPGTAGDGLILRAPRGVDFSPPFNVAPNSTSLAVLKEGRAATGGRPITYEFFAQSVSVGPRFAPSAAAPAGPSTAGRTLTGAEQETVDTAQGSIEPYCRAPQTTPPAAVTGAVDQLLALLRHDPRGVAASGKFNGQTVRQISADFGGLLNAGCAPGLGARVGRALRGR